MPLKAGRFYEFGPYRLDAEQLLLWNHDELVPLTPKALETLLALVESPGRLVGKDELMKRLWPDTFVEENNLAFNISVLRKALTDGQSGFAYIETIPRRGYRFIASVVETGPAVPNTGTTDATSLPAMGTGTAPAGGLNGTAVRDAGAGLTPVLGSNGSLRKEGGPQGEPLPAPAPTTSQAARLEARRRPSPMTLAVIGLIASVIGCVWLLVRPLPLPVLTPVPRQLTHDSLEKRGPLLTDGPRLYFYEKKASDWVLVSLLAEGGEPSVVPVPSASVTASDISADGAWFLGNDNPEGEGRVVTWPVTGGPVQYVGGLRGREATWSPDGTRVAYIDDRRRLVVTSRNGESPRDFGMPAVVQSSPHWSPNGGRLRFSVGDPRSPHSWSLWETTLDGGSPHPVLPGRNGAEKAVFAAGWTGEGSWFILSSNGPGQDALAGIWALRENCGLFRWRCRQPLPVGTGASRYFSPLPSRDGSSIFAIGSQSKWQVERYDQRLGAFTSYLGGAPAADLGFSRDEQWVAYIREPDHTLWRSKIDGSDRRQLTSTATFTDVHWPQWSPDGSKITFMADVGGPHLRAYAVAAAGGEPPQPLVGEAGEEGVPTWSPDGQSLVWGDPLYRHSPYEMKIHHLDLSTHQVADLPDSFGLWTPRSSPNGRYIAAVAVDRGLRSNLALFPAGEFRLPGLWLFDVGAREWNRLVPMSIDQIAWARDSRSVYFNTITDRTVYRVGTSGGKAEPIVSLGGLSTNSEWAGVTPDGSPLVTHSLDIQEIYALDVGWP